MRITIVVNSLGPGGAERQASLLASYCSRDGHATTLLTYNHRGTGEIPDHWTVGPSVRRIFVEFGSAAPYPLRIIGSGVNAARRLRTAIRSTDPDVVVSFIDKTNMIVLLALVGTGIPVVISERVHFPMHDIGIRWSTLRRLLYPLSSVVVTQTRQTAEAAARLVRRSRVRVIPNIVEAVPPTRAGAGSAWAGRPRASLRIVGIGRLTRQKGFDLQIRALREISDRIPDAQLLILGVGPAHDSLVSLAADLGVADRVHLPGVVDDVRPTLESSDIFVLSSRFEGFPNALVEAMACGTAVIATRCPSGPEDIVTDGVDGLLVPTDRADAIATSLHRLATDERLRATLGERARSVVDRFSPDVVIPLWVEALRAARGG